MAEPKSASLVVLGGPLAGTKYLLEENVDSITVGSDPSCGFCIPLPGVSPIHAWLRVDDSGVSVHEAGGQGGLHVNDQTVSGESPLRNGDILWLGTPGEHDVVMLQCVLPPRAASAPAPPARKPKASEMPSDETLMLGQIAAAAAGEAEPPEAEGLPEFMPEPAGLPEFTEAPPSSAGSVSAAEDAAAVEEARAAFFEEAPPEAETPQEAAADEFAVDSASQLTEDAVPELTAHAEPEFAADSVPEPASLAEEQVELVEDAPPAVETAPETHVSEFVEEEEPALVADVAPEPEPVVLIDEGHMAAGTALEPEPYAAPEPDPYAAHEPEPYAASEPEPYSVSEPYGAPESYAAAEASAPAEASDDFFVEDAGAAQPPAHTAYAAGSASDVPELEPVPEFEEQPVQFHADEPAPIPPSVPAFFEDETEPTVVALSPPGFSEPPVPPPPPSAEPQQDWVSSRARARDVPLAPPPPPPPEPPAPKAPAPARVAPGTSARPSGPVTTTLPRQRVEAPPTPSLQRPRTTPPRSPRPTPSAARVRPSSPVGRYAAFGVGGLAVVAALGFLGMRLLSEDKPSSAPAATPAPPVTVAAQVAPPPAQVDAPPPQPPPPIEPAPSAAPVEEAVTIVPSPPAKPLPTPSAQATPKTASPAATPSPKKGSPAPAVATATGPSAEALRAQQVAAQVAGLMQQADGAAAAHRYDAAVTAYDEVLKLDPQNAKAQAGRAGAISARDLSRRSFVAGRTVVQAAKAAKGGLEGFESTGVAVKQAPDFLGRIEFEMSPSAVKPGDSYVLKFYLINEGKKSIKVSGVTATTLVNGDKSGGPVTARVKEVDPQQRALLGEMGGVWGDSTKSWTAEVLLTANKGDSLRNQLNWR
jgi:hypothetical protein